MVSIVQVRQHFSMFSIKRKLNKFKQYVFDGELEFIEILEEHFFYERLICEVKDSSCTGNTTKL